MSIISPHSGSIVVGERLINAVVEGTLMALFVAVLFRLKTFRDSATRFAIWLTTLLVILILPLLGSSGASRLMGTSAPHVSVPAALLGYAVGAWAVIALFGIIRIGAGVLQLRGLRQRARDLDRTELPLEAQSVLEEFSSRRDVRIRVSNEINAPTAVGFIRPAVLMPAWALSELSGERLRSVLLHELGHLRRWDDWTNLLQKVLRAIFFFHPAVWWIDSRLCLEREMACDDLVLAKTSDAHGYAECLVSLAEKSMLRRGVALAVAAVGRVRQMTRRLGRILDQDSRGRVPRVAMASLTVFGVVAVAASARLPMLVVLQESVPSTPALAREVDTVTPSEARMQLTSAPSNEHHSNVIPAVMKVQSLQKSDLKTAKPRALRTSQRAQAASKPRMMQASLRSRNRQTNLQSSWLLIVSAVQTDVSKSPAMVLSRPFSATFAYSEPSGSWTIESNGIVQFTIYRSSGAIRNEIVANVI